MAKRFVVGPRGRPGKPYRLISEAEWEYAARAGTTTPYSFDGDEAVLGEYAWYDDNRTHPVGEKKANAFGLFDMHGNVVKWVEACYHDSDGGSPTDGSAGTAGDCGSRAVRGGSWSTDPQFLRS